MLNTIDQNFNLHAARIPSITTAMEVRHLPGLTFVDSGLSCDTFNIIHITDGARVNQPNLFQAIHHFRNKHFPFCIWISRENLIHTVANIFEAGSVKQQNAEPGMVLELTHYSPVQETLHENITLVRTAQALRDFAEVIALNWTPPDENVRKYFELTAGHYLDPSNKIELAIYYLEGKPVSVIEMFSSDQQTLGLYSLATLADYRGKGIGSALMKFALNKAKTGGYKNVILQASEDGISIYTKYGFQTKTHYYEFA
jgi:GNAT superfamily N-acetyltransferase